MRHLVLSSVLFLSSVASADSIQSNDLLSAYIDNDEQAELLQLHPERFNKPLVEESSILTPVETRGYFYKAEQVLSTLTPFLESQFDTIIIANTATNGSSGDMVPFQHARILIKKNSALKIFNRDANGKVVGILEENLTPLEGIPQLLPISSGVAGNGGIRTFSGMFRVNLKRSKSHLNTSPRAGMSYAVYADAHYGTRESGLAIHGTPQRNHHKLGKVRASHGCLRTFPDFAKVIYQHVIKNESLVSKDIPKFKNLDNLPDDSVQKGESGTEEGVRALFIMFDGFENQAQDI